MTTSHVRRSAAAAALLVTVACSPRYYVPNTQNVPLIGARGQATMSVAGNRNQVELQGAYGVSDAVAVQVNGGLVIPPDEENGNGGSGKLIEGGVGYFRNLSPAVLFDVYALAGVGTLENHFPGTVTANPGTTGEVSASLRRFGIQPSISYHTDNWSITGSARLARLSYHNVEGSLIFDGVNQVDYLNANASHNLFEPALTLRGGIGRFQVQVQASRSVNLTDSAFKQDESLITVGAVLRFK
jgi:hypothetical protein